jgi:hypothetical protein
VPSHSQRRFKAGLFGKPRLHGRIEQKYLPARS